MQTIFDVLSKTKVGDKLSDGKRTWKVVESPQVKQDCFIAIPVKSKWPKKESYFELWGDAMSKVSYMPKLTIIKKTKKGLGK